MLYTLGSALEYQCILQSLPFLENCRVQVLRFMVRMYIEEEKGN